MTNLVIATIQIRQLDGLFNLNDLHKAAGGEANHRPNQFLRLDQTKELIKEIKCADLRISSNSKSSDMRISPVKTRKGANGGTFSCKELVIAYAAWINPKVHLQTINAFLGKLEQQKNKYPPYDLNNLPETNHNGQRIMPPIHNEQPDVPVQYFIIKQQQGKAAETHELDFMMLRELVNTQTEYGLIPNSMLNALVTSLGDAMDKSTRMIQFSQAKFAGAGE